MEECKLTKRPCRAAIKESVDKCKNPIILRNMYQIVELLRKMVDDVEYKELSEADHRRAIIIRDVLCLEDREVKGVQYWMEYRKQKESRKERNNMVAELSREIETGQSLITDSTDMTMSEFVELAKGKTQFNTAYDAYLLGFSRGHEAALYKFAQCQNEDADSKDINYRAATMDLLGKMKQESNAKRVYRLTERLYIDEKL